MTYWKKCNGLIGMHNLLSSQQNKEMHRLLWNASWTHLLVPPLEPVLNSEQIRTTNLYYFGRFEEYTQVRDPMLLLLYVEELSAPHPLPPERYLLFIRFVRCIHYTLRISEQKHCMLHLYCKTSKPEEIKRIKLVKNSVFWDIIRRSPVKISRTFLREISPLHSVPEWAKQET